MAAPPASPARIKPVPAAIPAPAARTPGRGGRRDRRGRGMRGPLAPAGVPLSRSRARLFDDLVLDTVEQLEQRCGDQLDRVQFAVEDVPPLTMLGRDPLEPVPLGGWSPRHGETPAQVVVYRRPIEARANGVEELAELVHDVVIEEVAELLGLDPQVLDPGYGWHEGDAND